MQRYMVLLWTDALVLALGPSFQHYADCTSFFSAQDAKTARDWFCLGTKLTCNINRMQGKVSIVILRLVWKTPEPAWEGIIWCHRFLWKLKCYRGYRMQNNICKQTLNEYWVAR